MSCFSKHRISSPAVLRRARLEILHKKTMFSIWQDSQKNLISPFAIFKNNNLTIDPLSLGIQILRGVRIWSPFRVPGPERRVKRFRCFRDGRGSLSVPGARPKLVFFSDSPYPKLRPTHVLVPTDVFGRIYGAEPVSGTSSYHGPGRNTFRFGKFAPKYPWEPRNTRS